MRDSLGKPDLGRRSTRRDNHSAGETSTDTCVTCAFYRCITGAGVKDKTDTSFARAAITLPRAERPRRGRGRGIDEVIEDLREERTNRARVSVREGQVEGVHGARHRGGRDGGREEARHR